MFAVIFFKYKYKQLILMFRNAIFLNNLNQFGLIIPTNFLQMLHFANFKHPQLQTPLTIIKASLFIYIQLSLKLTH